jgi:ferritin
MEMSPGLEEAFNRQITLELESSLAYLQMAAHLEHRSLTGMSSWMRIQSEEERSHALRFVDYVLDRGNEVRIGAIVAPGGEFAAVTDVFRAALEHERTVSAAIRDLYQAASTEMDVASYPLLQWFLQEQVEEEATVTSIIDQLELIGDDGGALLVLDRELGGRTAAPATGG